MPNETLTSLLIIAVPLAVFYFLLIRPQKKKEKQVAQMRRKLEPGDSIVTIGGIVGRIISAKEDILTIESGAAKNKIQIMRWAVQSCESNIDDRELKELEEEVAEKTKKLKAKKEEIEPQTDDVETEAGGSEESES